MKEMKIDNPESPKKSSEDIELPFKATGRMMEKSQKDDKSEDIQDEPEDGNRQRDEGENKDEINDRSDAHQMINDEEERGSDSTDRSDFEDNDIDGKSGGVERDDSEDDDVIDEEEERAYEARRAARAERLRIRKQKRKRKRILVGVLSIAAVVLGCGVFYFGDELLVKIKAVQEEAQQAMEERQVKAREDAQEEIQQASADGEKEGSGKADNTSEESNDGENAAKGNSDEKNTQDAQTKTDSQETLTTEEKKYYVRAKKYAAQYDYDKAIKTLKKCDTYDANEKLQTAAKKYKKLKDSCVSWPIEEVTHVFYHSLIVDTDKAFDGDYKTGDYNQVMTTIDEFNKITQAMYDKGYVMVSIYDLAKADENGNITRGEILLPPGKIPFVLSQDDLCYYHYMDGDGFASKLVVDEDGKVRNEYIEDDGSVSVGDYDMVPLIDRFVEEHPDFSYRGAKGIVALTGYNGILGYRTDSSYETRPDDLDYNKVEWLNAHPDFSLEEERANASKVAQAMKDEGWLFASHTWGHKNIAETSMERLQTDTQNFKENVDPLIGGTDIIIFAFGTDLTQTEDYSGEKFDYLKSQGYNYYCNVDSQKYFVQIRDNYFRMGRRNLDGYRMYYNPELLEDLFNASELFDPARPVPVPPMG